jgi:integrase
MDGLDEKNYFNKDQIKDLLKTIEYIKSKNYRNGLLVELALKTGIRQGEIITLRKRDLILLEGGVGAVWVEYPLKNSKQRAVVVSKKFFLELKAYADSIETENLFPISTSRIRHIWRLVKPLDRRFHTLRHTYAKHLYQKSKDLQQVQQDLGHANIRNTMVYAVVAQKPSQRRKWAL